MAEPARKPRIPRRKELQENYKTLEEATVLRHRRSELDLLKGAEHYQLSEADLMNGESILHSPLHPTTAPPDLNFAFLSDFEGSSRSLLRSPELGIANGGYFYSSSSVVPPQSTSEERKNPELLDDEEQHKIVQVKNSECDKPAHKLYLQFSGLTYTVYRKQSRWQRFQGVLFPNLKRPPPKPLRVLDGISGEARDGEILAIMGPSGSGKSTLIDALAQRIGVVKGSMTLNGNRFGERLLRNISAYVMQV